MSVLTSKNVLIAGKENSQIFKLEDVLRAHGMIIHTSPCEDVNSELINKLNINLIILNHTDNGDSCKDIMNILQGVDFDEPIPSFVMVEDDNDKIQEVISYGAADYITPQEDMQSVTHKLKTIFTKEDKFSGASAIDISPVKASLSSTGIRVYVVEDDPLLRNLLSIRLDKSSFPYEFSSDGKHVVPLIKKFKPDVIVLDLMLPGVSGFEILSQIKADESLKDIPVMVFSNRDGQDDRQKAEQLGAAAFYVKAMTDLSELIEKIESLAA